MPLQLVRRASDIRITEINLSQIILGSSSSVALIPIISKRGSVKPRNFTNATDFLYEYGNPDPSVSSTIQSALNYLSEGNNIWAIRVVNSDASARTSAVLIGATSVGGAPQAVGIAISGDPSELTKSDLDALAKTTTLGAGAVGYALFFANRGPGSYGNDFSIQIQSLVPPGIVPTLTIDTTSPAGTLPAGVYTYKVDARNTLGEQLSSTSPTITVSAGNKVKITGTIAADIIARGMVTQLAIYRSVAGASSTNFLASLNPAEFVYNAATNTYSYTFVDDGSRTTTSAVPPSASLTSAEFMVVVYSNTATPNTVLETWKCTFQPKVGSDGVQEELEARINPFSTYIQVKNGIASNDVSVPSVSIDTNLSAMAGGGSGTAPTSYNVVSALEVFQNSQLYPINIIINGGLADAIVGKGMDKLAEDRGDCVSLLDVPSTSQKYQNAADYRNLTLNLNSTYSALFCPDLLIADLINGQQLYTPPSGFAAALCARTDRVANPAYSIAGLNRGLINALKSRYDYDDAQATVLYQSQVNYSRTFVGQGIALWEQQTLAAQPSALSWLSVRRIINVIKVSMYKFLLYALQEQNTDALRRNIVNSISTYLNVVRSSNGIYDFTVECDDANNPPAARNAGVLAITVALIPQIPVHEIQLSVVITKSGVSFGEVLKSLNGG